MRNLKKILALVLALVMSLSLMATAGAAETAAAAADPYATAQTVLTGLKVFRGDTAGQMNWNQPITRVQTAALVYRINTGDVDDTKAGLHTSNPFADVAASYWGNSYISYGYNAGILKGMGGNNFAPDNQVTGYQTLAMILRAMGYGRNGEFEGTGWEVRTASTAQSLGLLKNVTPSDSTTLGQPASRGLVAEILLRALLTNKVMYSALNPYNYTELDEKLADNLDLEEIKGAVVIANEWAALDDTKPLAANKTKVELADGTTRTLNWSAGDKETGADYATGVMDIGKSRDAYIQGSKVLALADSGNNVVKDNEGKAAKVSSLRDGLAVNDTTKHYTNFADPDRTYSDWRLEIRLSITPAAIGDAKDHFNVSRTNIEKALDAAKSEDADGTLNYEKVIPANTTITPAQISVLKEIFRIADDRDVSLRIKGEVYAGTRSLSDSDDLSNTLTYRQFEEKYILTEKTPVTETGNGNWLQVVDNDNDGVAEYVLLVEYDLDTIVENKSDKFYYRGLDIENFTPVTIDGYTQTVGDVVLYAVIDGKAYVHKAATETASFKTVDYKNVKATDTNGKEWEQSAIDNHTTLPDKLVDVDELTNYNLYLDDYGYVRAYDSHVGYALLTEMYPTRDWNSAWVVDRNLTVEAMRVGDTAVKEYPVLNNYYNGTVNPFFRTSEDGRVALPWKYPGITNNRDAINVGRPNYLTPATHMLDVAGREGYTFNYIGDDRFVARDANGEAIWDDVNGRWSLQDGWKSYETSDGVEYNEWSWTNVAKYTQTDAGLNLYTAASAGSSNGVKSDYIRLSNDIAYNTTINKTNPLFPMDDEYYDEIYTSADRHYVRAVDGTVFFLVTVNENGTQGIRQYTGYSNVPTLDWENNVRSMYAVAHSATQDENVNSQDYWVADVIVIEMYDYNVYESVSLIYSNNYKNQGDVKYVEAIDSVKGEIRIIPNNYNVWNGRFTGLGFYGLNNIVAVEGQENTYTADIIRISDSDHGWYEENEYNKHGIYYGQVRSLYSEDAYSSYVTLDILDDNGLVVGTKDVRVTLGAWGIHSTGSNDVNNAVSLLLKSTTYNNKVEVGDKVIWVETSDRASARTAGFLVDLTDRDVDTYNNITTKRSWYPNPTFLNTEASQISRAQWTGKTPDAAWNYEEIIGKRNDLTNQPKWVDDGNNVRIEDDRGFVVNRYTLSINGVAQEPVYEGSDMSDGLWHIRYYIPAESIVTVDVKRDDVVNGRGSSLVLNKDTITNGVPVGTAESWTFVMPTPETGKTVLGTIFEVGANIPTMDVNTTTTSKTAKVDRVFANADVCAAYLAAVSGLNTAADDAKKAVAADKTLTDAEKAEKTIAIEAARVKAMAEVNTAANWNKNDVPAIESAAAAGVAAIKALVGEVVVEPVDTTEAMAILKTAYDAVENKTQAVEDAYTAAKAAVEAAAKAANATPESVKAVAEAEAAKITAAAAPTPTPEEIEAAKTEANTKIDDAVAASEALTGLTDDQKAEIAQIAQDAKDAIANMTGLDEIAAKAAEAVAAIEAIKPIEQDKQVTVTLNRIIKSGTEEELFDTATKTYELQDDGAIHIPEADVKKPDLAILNHTVTVGEAAETVNLEGGYYVIEAAAGSEIVVNIKIEAYSIPVPQASGRISVRTLSGNGSKESTATFLLKEGQSLDQENTRIMSGGVDGIEFVWSTLASVKVGAWVMWTVQVSFTAEALQELAAAGKTELGVVPAIKVEKQYYTVTINNPDNATVTVTNAAGETIENGSTVEEGTELTVTASVEDETKTVEITINGIKNENGAKHVVTGETAIEVSVKPVEEEDNAPEITVKVVDEAGADVAEADVTVTEEHEAVTTLGKTSYDYTWKVVITDSTKYQLATTGAEFAYADKTAAPSPSAYGAAAADGSRSFTLKTVEKAGTLTIKVKAADTVSVTLQDKVTLSIDKDKFLKGTDRKDQTITLKVTDTYAAKGYTLPVAPEIYTSKEGKLLPGTAYVYDKTSGVITFKTGKFDEDIEIRGNALPENGVTVTNAGTASAKFTVSPAKVARTTFAELPPIQIVPAAGKAYPAKSTVTVTMADAAGTQAAVAKTKWSYDETTGQVTFSGSDSVTGAIQISVSAINNAIEKLDAQVRDGVLEVKTASGAALSVNAQYMVVNAAASPNLYAKVESLINGWFMAEPKTYAAQLRDNGGDFVFTSAKPVLTADNKDDYVVIVDVDEAISDASAVINKAAVVKVPEISGAVVGPDTVTITDTNLLVSREGDRITITAKTAGYPVPTAGFTVSVGGVVLTGGNGTDRMYNVIPDGQGTQTVIELLTDKTGNVVIDVSSTSMVKALTITMDTEGNFTIVKDGATVSSQTNYKFIPMDSDSVAGMINQVTADKTSVKDYLIAIGMNGEDTDGTAVTGTAVSPATGVPAASDTAKYLLIVEYDSTVKSAGIVENKKLAAVPELNSSETQTLFGVNLASNLGTVGRTPYETVADSQIAALDQSGAASALVLTPKTSGDHWEAVFIPNWSSFEVSSNTDWAQIKTAEGAQALTTARDTTDTNDNLLAKVKAGADPDLLKNGTLWIQVTDQTNDNNNGYYAVPIKFKNTGIESDLNLAAPGTGSAYVFLSKAAAGVGNNGVIRVALVGSDGAEEVLDLNTAGAYVYAIVAKNGTSGKIVVTTADTNTGTAAGDKTTVAGVTIAGTGATNFTTDNTTKVEGAAGSGIVTWTYAQNNGTTAIDAATTYVTVTIALS